MHFYFSSSYMKFCFFRCSPDDAGEYKVVAKSPLGEAMTFGTLVVNCEYFTISYQLHPAGKPLWIIQRWDIIQ